LQEAVPENRLPWEVWKYARGRGNKFVFVDETGFGNWALVWTDSRIEPTRGDWQDFFSPNDLRRVQGF
jgi:hypothetical protein